MATEVVIGPPREMRRVAELKAMPEGTRLPPLTEMVGYEEWARSPVTKEMLARVIYRQGYYEAKARGLKACHACGRKSPDSAEMHFVGGVAEALKDVGRTMDPDMKICDCASVLPWSDPGRGQRWRERTTGVVVEVLDVHGLRASVRQVGRQTQIELTFQELRVGFELVPA